MGIFNNDLYIDKTNPFENDRLDRKKEAIKLTNLFEIVENQMVLAITSPWGTGKTSFLKMWNQYLKNEGYKTIFFSAWENDFTEDAFVVFIDEIRASINDESKTAALMSKVKKVLPGIIKQAPKAANMILKHTTGIDADQFISMEDIEALCMKGLEEYSTYKASIEQFKKELTKLAKDQLEESGKPLVLFIDELDRCKPEYAICLLERVKHLFNVENIIFILGIDKEALNNSVRTIYGLSTDTTAYLTRFIDVEYTLKGDRRENFIDSLLLKYKFQEVFNDREYIIRNNDMEVSFRDFAKLIQQVFIQFNVSLRDMEKIILQIYIILKSNQQFQIYPFILVVLVVIKKQNKELYQKLKDNKLKFNEFIELKSKDSNIEKWFESDYNIAHIVKAVLLALLNDVQEIDKIKKSQEFGDNTSDFEINRRCIELLNLIRSTYDGNRECYINSRTRESIFEKIELQDGLEKLS